MRTETFALRITTLVSRSVGSHLKQSHFNFIIH